jgi:hypothetical protein
MHPLFSSLVLLLRLREGRGSIERVQLALILLMQLAFLGAIGLSIYARDWLTLFVCIIGLGTVWMARLLARNLNIYLPLEFELILNVFIYASLFLGEVRGFYTRFWWWDIVLHAGAGMALGLIGFLLLYSLYRSGRLRASPFLVCAFSFSFALALGTIWEIFEFSMDALFAFNLQKGAANTMRDLIVDTVGALLVSVFGYLYIRKVTTGMGVFHHFIQAYFVRNARRTTRTVRR